MDPRFGTAVPHPGLDLEGPAGTPFRAVLEGTVLWAGALRGYGLTAIVDHGAGVATVYAHAAGLVVEKGEQVARGQTLGHVGETGDRAPYLYFELREGGKPGRSGGLAHAPLGSRPSHAAVAGGRAAM